MQHLKQTVMQIMGQVAVDIEQSIAVLAFMDDMLVPDFLKQCLAHEYLSTALETCPVCLMAGG